MSKRVNVASGIAVAATLLTALLSPNGSGARADEAVPVLVQETTQLQIITGSVVAQPEPETAPTKTAPAQPGFATPSRVATLAEHVRTQPRSGNLDAQMHCLAGAIYFEARGESLAGQLAVGRVVVERANSGRFPGSYCGVVYQRSQFSFVRGQAMPTIPENSAAWQSAKALARIAHEGTWQSPSEGALFFHATHVAPRWRLKRIAQVDNHIFYR